MSVVQHCVPDWSLPRLMCRYLNPSCPPLLEGGTSVSACVQWTWLSLCCTQHTWKSWLWRQLIDTSENVTLYVIIQYIVKNSSANTGRVACVYNCEYLSKWPVNSRPSEGALTVQEGAHSIELIRPKAQRVIYFVLLK